MKLIFLMIIAVSSAVTSSVFAADLSPRAPPPVFVPPPFTWTGFYVGAEVGYAWGQDNINGYPYDYRAWGLTSVDSVGVLGGAHIGYNYQVNQFLYGIEGDVDGSQFQKSTYGAFGNNYDTRVSIQGSIRGRFGLGFDHTLVYVTGGVALADVQHYYSISGNSFVPPSVLDTFSQTRIGWAVGGGVQYAFNDAWSLRAEYRYTDFGGSTDNNVLGSFAFDHHLIENSIRFGISYKFDTYAPSPPVVAKY